MTKILISYIVICVNTSLFQNKLHEVPEIAEKIKEGYELHGQMACAEFYCRQAMVKYAMENQPPQ